MKKLLPFALSVLMSTAVFAQIPGATAGIDTAKLSQSLAVLKNHAGDYRGVTTYVPANELPMNLTRPIIFPKGDDNGVTTTYAPRDGRILMYQKEDTMLLGIRNFAPTNNEYYDGFILLVGGQTKMITVWTAGVFTNWQVHRWNPTRYYVTNENGKVLTVTAGGAPDKLQELVFSVVVANLDVLCGKMVFDADSTMNATAYALVDKYQKTANDNNMIVMLKDGQMLSRSATGIDIAKIKNPLTGEDSRARHAEVDYLKKVVHIVDEVHLKPMNIMTRTANGATVAPNPDFDPNKDIVRYDYPLEQEKLVMLYLTKT